MSILKEPKKEKTASGFNRGRIIAVVVIAACVLTFVISSISISNSSKYITTEIAMLDSQRKTISVDMFVVRDENILTSSGSNIVSAVSDGTRVSVNDTIAYSFADATSAANVRRLTEVNEELEYYTALSNKSSYLTDNLTSFDNKIMESVADLSVAVSSGELSDIAQLKVNLRDTITSKQTATGVELDLSEKISSLTAERTQLESASGKYTEILANGTGYYISGVDGYENVLDYASVDEWDIELVEKAMSASASEVSSNQFGRLVNRYYWYMVCVVDTAEINALREDRRYEIGFYDSAVDEITCTVYKIRSDAQSGKSLVIFKCNTMTEEVASLRHEYAYIVTSTYSGYKIDNRALRTNDNNESGVYVLDGHMIMFKKVNIVYSDNDYSLVSSEELINYDEYVVTGRDLYNKKVVR